MSVGEQIRRARKAKGMTQQDFADAVGVTVRSVSYWERGDREPHGARLREIARVAGRPTEFFYGEQEAK